MWKFQSSKPTLFCLEMELTSLSLLVNRSVVEWLDLLSDLQPSVSGDGFLAMDITIDNKLDQEKHQGSCLEITLYCALISNFYRECDISGTIDYLFGNAAVVFQACNIISRKPLPNQFTVITAQSKETPDEYTGISIQNCSILATEDLYSNSSTVRSYLGRPWKVYSTTVVLESYIDGFINPEGWSKWSDDDGQGLDTLYYGE
ncbi:hypothetical protein D5086_012940 [Populus alba]|uniref:Uncharacterized protein n=1 Tax=Populus alba TaxID=43335 RepID=A0ACC4C4C6_POPAL